MNTFSVHDPRRPPIPSAAPPAESRWHTLAQQVLAGHGLTREEGLAVLRSGAEELLDLLAAAYRIRYRHFGSRVHLNFLINAKSGICPEDCGYCSQSRISRAEIPKYNILSAEKVLDGARLAAERQAKTYCIVISGRSPTPREMHALCEIVPQIKGQYPLSICVSPGLLDAGQAARLKAAGVDRVNHNLNTSRRFYPTICSTHSFDDRLATLRVAREAGLELCCGGIVGLGEEDEDVVDMALTLAELEAEAVPLNFLNPIPGTPLEGPARLTPVYCLKALALLRLAVPRCELRIAAGRETHLKNLQALGLYAANSIFVGDYLTTEGQPAEEDYRMIEDLGFSVVLDGARLAEEG